VALRRYATEGFAVQLGSVTGGQAAAIHLPPDGSDQPWELGLSGRGTARVCEAGG
jgi:hypothetical protein